MRRQTWKKGIGLLLALALSMEAPFPMPLSSGRVYAYTERQAVINASSLNVRSGPGTSYSRVSNLAKGTTVTVINETTGSDGKQWYQIRLSNGSTGYVLGVYIRFPVSYNQDSNFENQLSSQGFPESYKPALRQLHAQYPNWIFEAQQTGLDWNTVIQNESIIPRSLIHKNSISSHKSVADGAYNWDTGVWTGFDGSSWVAASEEIIRYYMDPRNFLDDVYIFQFMNHSYDASTQTREGLQALVQGTFLDGNTTGGGSWQDSGNNTTSTPNGGGPSSGGPGVVGTPGSSNQNSGTSSPGPGSSGSSTVPGSSGGNTSPGNTSPGNGSPGAPGGSDVKLKGPSASISVHPVARVATTVRVGVSPGQGGQGGQNAPSGGTSSSPGGGALSPGPGSSMGTSSGQTSGGPGGSSSSGPSQGSSVPDNSSGNQQTGGSGNISYVDVIMKAAEVSGVNPYVLAAMILQEQGKDGRGNSITGTNASYPGYYNYFNVGAYASDGMGAVERGLWYSSQSGTYGRPWKTPEKSIIGGAQFYGDNYVRAGQDTFYLKKYNVQGSNLYKHQYMTNVDGAASEGSIFAESYSDRLKSTSLRFKIPVFTGMPDSPCAKPTGDGSPNNKLRELRVDGFALTPTFNRDINSYNVFVGDSVNNISVSAAAIDSGAVITGAGSYLLSGNSSEIRIRVRAANGNERDYMIYVIRQGGGPVYDNNTVSNPSGNSSAGPGVVNGPGGSAPGTAAPGRSMTPGSSPPGNMPTPGGDNVIVISP